MNEQSLSAIEGILPHIPEGPWEWRSWELGLQLQPKDKEDWPIMVCKSCGNNNGVGCKPEGQPGDPEKTCALMPDKAVRLFIAESRVLIPKLVAEVRRLNAEVEMLRGVGCQENGDGPCGACLKCAKEEAARWKTDAAMWKARAQEGRSA